MIYYAFLLFFVLEYVRPGNYVPGLDVLHLNSLVPLTVVAGTLWGKTRVSNQDFFADPNAKIILGLYSLIVLSVATATVTMHAYKVMNDVLGYVIIFWIIIRQVDDVRKIKGVFVTLIVVHLMVAALNPVMFTQPDARHYIGSGAFLGDGNDFALSVNLAIPFCLFLLFESRKWYTKPVVGACLLLLVLCVIATKSRGGTIGLACVGFYYWMRSNRKGMMAAIAVVLLGIVLVSAPPAYFERMQHIADTEEGSAQGRILAWTAGAKMALKNPLLGAGAGHFPITYGQFYRTRTDIPWQTAHSIYFLVLGELGVPGITFLLAFIFWNLSANRKALRELAGRSDALAAKHRNLIVCLSASVIAFATCGAFLSATYYPHMYILAGLMSSARRVVREQSAAAVAIEAGQAPRPAVAAALRLGSGRISPDWRPRRSVEAQPEQRLRQVK
jgi:probable O-glycosylation ligase (exosortase A-associated)